MVVPLKKNIHFIVYKQLMNGFVASGEAQPAVPAGQTQTNIGTGSDEFMNTKFMQQNIANNTPFTEQLRWDPARRQYVKIGRLINEGRLDVRDKLARLKAPRRGRGGGGGGGL